MLLRLPGDFVHGAWLLNRFHNHSTTKTSAFELVHGRKYARKIASFGEVVLVLHRQGPHTKAGPQWVPGVWLAKTDGYDLHVVATPEGLLRGKAIRSHTRPLGTYVVAHGSGEALQKFTRKATLKNLRVGAPPTPKPVVERQESFLTKPLTMMPDM